MYRATYMGLSVIRISHRWGFLVDSSGEEAEEVLQKRQKKRMTMGGFVVDSSSG